MRQSRSLAERRALLNPRQIEDDSDTDSELEFEGEDVVVRPVLAPEIGAGGNFVLNPSIRTLTAIPPSQVKSTALSRPPNPSTLVTSIVAAPPVVTRTLPNIVVTRPTAVLEVAPSIQPGVGLIPGPADQTNEDGLQAEPGAEAEGEVVPTGAYVAELEGGVGATGLPELGLGEKESEVVLPENNRGTAIGIAFGALALLVVMVVGGFLLVKWRKKSKASFFDRPPPPGIDRSEPEKAAVPPPSYTNEKMPDQSQYGTYANLEGGGGGVRQSLNRWIETTRSRFSTPTPTTDGGRGILSMYGQQNEPVPPPPSFLRPGGRG